MERLETLTVDFISQIDFTLNSVRDPKPQGYG
jgi:hypothetical protein